MRCSISKIIFSAFVFFVFGFVFIAPPVFAENVQVNIPSGTSVPGCETTNDCFVPNRVLLTVGDEVTWTNDDTAAHTVTAGSAADGPSGVFDSSLFMAGTTFSHKFDAKGEFPYFCMVHPWMSGIVLVGETMAKNPESMPIEVPPMENTANSSEQISLKHEIQGGKIISIYPDTDANSLIINLNAETSGQVKVSLPRDIIDAKIGNSDDVFFVLVDGEEVVYEETKTEKDRTLTIQFPQGAEEIEIIGTFVIPEFETITLMVLSIAIISLIIVSTKSPRGIFARI